MNQPDDNLPESTPDREDLLIRNLFLCKTPREAAKKAGYSDSYTESGLIYRRLKSPKMQEKIRRYAIANELLNIPAILDLERGAIKYLQDKPQELPKFAAILKQKKQIAGLLQQDVVPTAPTINIKEVRNLMLNVSHNERITADNQGTQVQDAEVIE
jgi:hypothetical protein